MRSFHYTRWMFFFGILFLYLPMISLIVYSFNESRLVTVWAGWSTKWYGELIHDSDLMAAVGRSFQVAFWAANTSVVLGVLASVVIIRIPRFRGKQLFSSMITAPLVMPDVIIGLSLLLLFVTMAQELGWPEQRGLITVWIAHATFCTAYTTVVVSSRLKEMDQSIVEAALDLGASPLKAFLQITIPIISPALASAWLLAFTLSLDDVVIASFVSGPSATTLPIEVFSSVRLGVSPKINALATIIILLVSMITLFIWWMIRRQEKRQQGSVVIS